MQQFVIHPRSEVVKLHAKINRAQSYQTRPDEF
jgi:hypothetical protein